MDADRLLAQDLDEYLAGDSVPTGSNPDDAPPAPDPLEASRLLRRLARLRAEGDAVATHAQTEINRITEWLEDRTAGIRREMDWAERSLEGFMRHHFATTGQKSVSLPTGTLRLRAPRSKVYVGDTDAFLAWAREHAPELVRVTEVPNKAELAKLPAPPPGVEFQKPDEDSFSYEPTEVE